MDRPARQKKAINYSDFLYDCNNDKNVVTVKPRPNRKARASRKACTDSKTRKNGTIDAPAKAGNKRVSQDEKLHTRDLEAALILSQIQSTAKSEEPFGSSQGLQAAVPSTNDDPSSCNTPEDTPTVLSDCSEEGVCMENFLLELAESSEEENILEECEESEDSAEGDLLPDGKSEPTLHSPSAESSDEEWLLTANQHPGKRFKHSDSSKSSRVSALNQKKGRKTRPPSVVSPDTPKEKWNKSTDEDITPQPPVFRPSRTPGPQLNPTASYTVLQLFQLFLSTSVLQTILINTNAYGEKLKKGPKQWKDLSMNDLYSYLLLVIFMGLVKVRSLKDYWRKSDTFKIPFPAHVMSSRKFFTISSALHLSDPEVDAENVRKRGTAAFDRLCKIKPMYLQMRDACKNYFHPYQNIAIDERMVATKARNGLKQYIKGKPTKWGYKLFVLADSRCAYTWDFFIYEGTSPEISSPQNHGLSYESVMALIDEKMLGTGYKLFVDNFYTSPELFQDLLKKNIFACGTIRPSNAGYPKTITNKLPNKAPRGTHRWLREGNLLFVEWKDTKEVHMCSTIHKGTESSTVQRKVKGKDGQWKNLDLPVPECVVEYNRYMGGVDVSDALIGYYTVLHKTRKWYQSFFYHFVDIAIVNAFILHRETACAKNQKPMTQKQFREKLIEELGALVLSNFPPPPSPLPEDMRHLPGNFASHSTKGRRTCKVCQQKTPVYCKTCLVPLCFQPKRDCFSAWHELH
ncbi:piggyBac transposable element-derived protein 4-like isoform X2 [Silurus meridionalis]|uniref:piggyBac transposable element-derived protein 4-like isoform X2 n=1 Tax=Silurus meridionalis TaxID=175797 RepID=UPI001EEB60B2|nr:piggyBac transposable element-derived protein 4-like isoform X2 [Silurus meridionalis]